MVVKRSWRWMRERSEQGNPTGKAHLCVELDDYPPRWTSSCGLFELPEEMLVDFGEDSEPHEAARAAAESAKRGVKVLCRRCWDSAPRVGFDPDAPRWQGDIEL